MLGNGEDDNEFPPLNWRSFSEKQRKLSNVCLKTNKLNN